MKPRIASYYENRLGRNDGNPLFVTHVLKRDYADQLEYHHLIPDPTLNFEALGKFDGHLWIDWGEDALKDVLPYTPIACPRPNVYWASDTHLGPEYRFTKADEFDHVFFAQQRAIEEYGRGAWLPHAVEPEAYNPAAIYAAGDEAVAKTAEVYRLKKWDVSFVGHLNDQARIDALDWLFREFPNSWWASRRTGRSFERAADIYTQSRICWNNAIRDDVNMRVFEVLATRSFLLTQDVPTIHDLFTDGVHLVTWKDMADCIDKAHYYLEHDEERARIAEAGYREVLAKHTFRHRVRRVLEPLGCLTPSK